MTTLRGHRVEIAACLSLALLFSLDPLVNSSLFPLFYGFAPAAKDVGTLVGAVALLALAAIAMHRPLPFISLATALAFACIAVLGISAIILGARYSSKELAMAGSVLLSIGGRTVVPLYTCFVLVKLDYRKAYLVLLVALVLFNPIAMLVGFLPAPLIWLYISIVPFVAPVLAHAGGASEILASAGKQRPADLSIANPRSFIPFSHVVFITFIFFNLATGCATSFLSDEHIPANTAFSMLPVIILLALALFKRFVDGDSLVKISCLFILSGFLVVPLSDLPNAAAQAITAASPLLFAAGSSCFTVVFYLVLSEIGRRNRYGAVPLFAFGFSASRIGFEAGALMGHTMNTSATSATVISIAMAFIFAFYGIIVLSRVSFRELIEDVRPVTLAMPPADSDEILERQLSEQCEIAIKRYALTPRESDIVRLLAQGRNIAVIQEKLVVSKNTVKTHVSNIYTKLDVHSQQELIDRIRAIS